MVVKYKATILEITFRDNVVTDLNYGVNEAAGFGPFYNRTTESTKGQVVQNTKSQSGSASQNRPTGKSIPTANVKKTVSEYWCWGLGVSVKTDQRTTITEIAEEGYSSAKTILKVGDEIVRVGTDFIDPENAQKILTKPLKREADGLVPVLVRRDGSDMQYRIKPNVF
jgi:hypothetical protein